MTFGAVRTPVERQLAPPGDPRPRTIMCTAGLLACGSSPIRAAFPVSPVTSGTPRADGSPLTVAESAPDLSQRDAPGFPLSPDRSLIGDREPPYVALDQLRCQYLELPGLKLSRPSWVSHPVSRWPTNRQ